MNLSFLRPSIILGLFFVCLLLVFYYQSRNRSYERFCTQDAINTISMDQDDPCILHQLRNNYLEPPSKEKLTLEHPKTENPSMGQAQSVLEILNYKKKGFFIECGALDGEIRSNTLFMEQYLDWEGVLIEANPKNYRNLRLKHRKAWTIPVCLSITTSPKIVVFEQNFNVGKISQNQLQDENLAGNVLVQCFPIYSILSALNRTTVDYFSLDIEGDELNVLRTIPWKSVHIQTLSVEYIHGKEGKEQIRQYMESQGYGIVKEVTHPMGLANDFIFNKI